MRLGPHPAVVMTAGEPPWLLDRVNYLTDPAYAGRFDPNLHVLPGRRTMSGIRAVLIPATLERVRCGLPGDSAIRWSGELRSAVKAHFAPTAWMSVARSGGRSNPCAATA
jgi:hypothetical protein